MRLKRSVYLLQDINLASIDYIIKIVLGKIMLSTICSDNIWANHDFSYESRDLKV